MLWPALACSGLYGLPGSGDHRQGPPRRQCAYFNGTNGDSVGADHIALRYTTRGDGQCLSCRQCVPAAPEAHVSRAHEQKALSQRGACCRRGACDCAQTVPSAGNQAPAAAGIKLQRLSRGQASGTFTACDFGACVFVRSLASEWNTRRLLGGTRVRLGGTRRLLGKWHHEAHGRAGTWKARE